jgi:sphinganine-1-phosphate aldolase
LNSLKARTQQFALRSRNLFIVGEPDVSVLALGSDIFNIYGLSDGMKKRGWNLNALQFPSAVHLCVTLLHTQPGVADKFIKDVKEITA